MTIFNIEGFNDILYEECNCYENITNTIKKIIKSYGYQQVMTPNFEYYDMYNIEGALPRDKMFKLVDNSGKVLVLRPDATIPITRMAASSFKNCDELTKLGYITSIYRETDTKTNLRKEFIQAGIEYFGNKSPECDAEIIAVSIDILLSLGFSKIHIDLGEVSFLSSLLKEFNIDANTKSKITKLIENKNISDLNTLLESLNISDSAREIISSLPLLFGVYEEVMPKARKICMNNEMKIALDNISKTIENLSLYNYDQYIFLDLGFTNQMNYYSGLIFKGYVNNFGKTVLSGGRYDNLSQIFGVDRPASGFGINVSKLVDVLKNDYIMDSHHPYIDVLLTYSTEDKEKAIKLAKLIRSKGGSADCNNIINNNNYINYLNIIECSDNSLFLIKDNIKKELSQEEILTKIFQEDA